MAQRPSVTTQQHIPPRNRTASHTLFSRAVSSARKPFWSTVTHTQSGESPQPLECATAATARNAWRMVEQGVESVQGWPSGEHRKGGLPCSVCPCPVPGPPRCARRPCFLGASADTWIREHVQGGTRLLVDAIRRSGGPVKTPPKAHVEWAHTCGYCNVQGSISCALLLRLQRRARLHQKP